MKSEYNISEIGDLIRDLKEYSDEIVRQFTLGVVDVASECEMKAQQEFNTADYDGVNDVVVQTEFEGKNTIAVKATSEQADPVTLFIEYGTGINNLDNHPEKPAEIKKRGSYGHGLGKLSSWRYVGEPGTNGVEDETHPGYVRTRGNKSNMCMYRAREHGTSSECVGMIEQKIKEVTK